MALQKTFSAGLINIVVSQLHIASGNTINHYLQATCNTYAYNKVKSSQEIIAIAQQDSEIKVSIEARINSVEYIPENDHLLGSSTKGTITTYALPKLTKRGSIDSSIALGTKIDSAKVNATIMIARGWGKDRQEACTES